MLTSMIGHAGVEPANYGSRVHRLTSLANAQYLILLKQRLLVYPIKLNYARIFADFFLFLLSASTDQSGNRPTSEFLGRGSG